jgi:hypothetical protein
MGKPPLLTKTLAEYLADRKVPYHSGLLNPVEFGTLLIELSSHTAHQMLDRGAAITGCGARRNAGHETSMTIPTVKMKILFLVAGVAMALVVMSSFEWRKDLTSNRVLEPVKGSHPAGQEPSPWADSTAMERETVKTISGLPTNRKGDVWQ